MQKILSSWGLSLAKNIIRLPGRVIPPENIYFGNDMVHSGSFLADWGKAAASSSVLSPVSMLSKSVTKVIVIRTL